MRNIWNHQDPLQRMEAICFFILLIRILLKEPAYGSRFEVLIQRAKTSLFICPSDSPWQANKVLQLWAILSKSRFK
jgi:hypothetical protein